MPFIVQCPHAECRKYMMLEDRMRGTTVDCLLCKKPIKVDASASESRPAVSAGNAQNQSLAAAPPKPASQQKVVTCPNPECKTPLKLPALKADQAIRCPKCKQVFTP